MADKFIKSVIQVENTHCYCSTMSRKTSFLFSDIKFGIFLSGEEPAVTEESQLKTTFSSSTSSWLFDSQRDTN